MSNKHDLSPLLLVYKLLLTVTVMFVGDSAASLADEPARPNILWITAEDLSPDLGCYGDAEARTPNLDRLAGQGARFTNAFTVAPVCAPSRSSIITGMYPTTIGTLHMRSKGVPPATVKCFTEYLRAAGYYCTNNVKTDYNFDSPVTAWDENSNKAHWRGRANGQPVFLKIDCSTEGASIAYTTDTGKNLKWKLYSGEMCLTTSTTVRLKACRLGYKDSEEVEVKFQIAKAEGK